MIKQKKCEAMYNIHVDSSHVNHFVRREQYLYRIIDDGIMIYLDEKDIPLAEIVKGILDGVVDKYRCFEEVQGISVMSKEEVEALLDIAEEEVY